MKYENCPPLESAEQVLKRIENKVSLTGKDIDDFIRAHAIVETDKLVVSVEVLAKVAYDIRTPSVISAVISKILEWTRDGNALIQPGTDFVPVKMITVFLTKEYETDR